MRHAASLVALGVSENVPGEQAKGAELPSSHWKPAGQPLQAIWPRRGWYVPALQLVQFGEPAFEAIVPGAQARQIPEPGLKWPGAQSSTLSTVTFRWEVTFSVTFLMNATETFSRATDPAVLEAFAPSACVRFPDASAASTAARTSSALTSGDVVPAALAARMSGEGGQPAADLGIRVGGDESDPMDDGRVQVWSDHDDQGPLTFQ